MALRNLASYKVGKEYTFDIQGVGVKRYKVLAKGDKKLQLLVNDIQDEIKTPWFTSDQLSLPEVKKKEQSPKKVAFMVTEKPLSKPVVELDIKTDKLVGSKEWTKKENPIEKPKVSSNIEKNKLADTLEPKEEDIDWQYNFGRFLKLIKASLSKKGYPEVMKMKQAELREWLVNKIPSKK